MDGEIEDRDPPDPLVNGVAGFIWTFTASLLIIAGGVFAALGIGTHLLIRIRPNAAQVVTYDPSTVATWAFVPIGAGLLIGTLYLWRLRRLRRAASR